MAGLITQTHTKRGPVGIITLTCTADASNASFPETVLTVRFSGRLLALETNPGAMAPTTNYDIVLDDADGHDVLEGVGANRHTSATEKANIVYSGGLDHPPVGVEDVLTFKITNNSVNSAIVVAKLYYEGHFEG